MKKISGVYQIINTETSDCYIGSSKNVMHRWACHKCSSTWEQHPNSSLYHDFQRYGVDKFSFQILALVEPEYLKQEEQEFIEMLHPSYNDKRAKGLDVERCKGTVRKYRQSDKGKEAKKKGNKKYYHQLCLYNGETLKLIALVHRFRRAGIEHYTLEARKYLVSDITN